MRPMLMFGAVMSITQAFSVCDVTMTLCGYPSRKVIRGRILWQYGRRKPEQLIQRLQRAAHGIEFPGGPTFFRLVTVAMMFTGYVTAIPNYLILNGLGWIDTYWSIIIPAFASPMGLFLTWKRLPRIFPW